MRSRVLLLAFVLAPLAAYAAESTAVPPQQSAPLTSADERAALHNSPDWALIAPHLPDPKTASAATLEMTGDVLRARRFPEDALDYYGFAMARGGNVSELLNKMGVKVYVITDTKDLYAFDPGHFTFSPRGHIDCAPDGTQSTRLRDRPILRSSVSTGRIFTSMSSPTLTIFWKTCRPLPRS